MVVEEYLNLVLVKSGIRARLLDWGIAVEIEIVEIHQPKTTLIDHWFPNHRVRKFSFVRSTKF